MTFQFLPKLYYRYFRCSSCGYQVQVAGEKFRDEACQNFMDSFHCIDCNVIHEKMVSEPTLHSTLPAYLELKEIFPEFDLHLPGSFSDYSVSELALFTEYKAIENIECYSCGSKRNINWSKEFPYCPKCRNTMEMKYKERPVPVPVALYGNEEQQKIHQFAIDRPGLIQEMISAYHSFTEEEIFQYRNWINWTVGSCNCDTQWNSKMIDHCRYYINWEMFSLNSAFQNTALIDEFAHQLTWEAVGDGNIGWSVASNKYILWTENLIDRYIDRIDFSCLSVNSNVYWSEHILKKYEDRWDWVDLTQNNNMRWTLRMMEMGVTHLRQMECDLLTLRFNTGMMSNLEIVEKYFDWFEPNRIFRNNRLPWHKENLLERWADKLDWDGLSLNQSLLRDPLFFEQNMEHWLENNAKRFNYFSLCVMLPWSYEFIERFYGFWNWKNFGYNPSLPWNEEFIDRYADKWDWNSLIKNAGIPWTIDLILKYNLSDEDAIFDNRSIWDKAIKPHLDGGLLEALLCLTKYIYPRNAKDFRHTQYSESWMQKQHYRILRGHFDDDE